MSDNFLVIIADGLENYQRNQIQAEVVRLVSNWWHEFPDCWIIETDDAPTVWRDRLMIVVGIGGEVLVLKLPRRGSRAWASKSSAGSWLRKHYVNTAPREPDDEPPF